MPKARKSKKTAKVSNTQSRAPRAPQNTTVAQPAPATNRRFVSPRVDGPRNLILPGMVALGCWGMAFSFAYFYNDPNHLLFAGMAAIMALLWTYSVVVRIRKLRITRQKGM